MTAASDKKFAIFRASDPALVVVDDIMTMVPFAEKVAAPMQVCADAGYGDGGTTRVIFAAFGLSIVHVWFKRAFPLPLHSHDADCLYYILAGSLRLGTEDLGVGDGFFVPSDVPYTYTPGSDGVELLEIRSKDRFDYRDKSSVAFWQKAARTVSANHDTWLTQERPSLSALSSPSFARGG